MQILTTLILILTIFSQMSSKAQITTSINTIDDGGQNTASEVRAVFETLNSEFFPSVDTITETIADETVTLLIRKSGNIVTINGSVVKINSNQFNSLNRTFLLNSKYHPLTTILIANTINGDEEGDVIFDNTIKSGTQIDIDGTLNIRGLINSRKHFINITYISNNE